MLRSLHSISRNFSTATSLLLARHRRCPAPPSPPWHSLTHSTRWPNMPEYVVTQPLPSSHLSLCLLPLSRSPLCSCTFFNVSQRPPPSPCPCQQPPPVSLARRGPRCHKKFFFGVVATTFTPSLSHQTLSLACPQLLCCFRTIFFNSFTNTMAPRRQSRPTSYLWSSCHILYVDAAHRVTRSHPSQSMACLTAQH